MEKLQKKLKKQGGFTLVEMLIVVAIIAILIAVSIPMVSGALDKAKEATDAANVRAAKAEASISYLMKTDSIDWVAENNGSKEYTVNAYDAEKGTIVAGDSADSITGYGKTSANEDKVIYLAVFKDIVYYQWAGTTPPEFKPSGDNPPTGWLTENKVV